MNTLQELDQWFNEQRKNHDLQDFKVFVKTFTEHEQELGRTLSATEKEQLMIKTAKAILNVVKNKEFSEDITDVKL